MNRILRRALVAIAATATVASGAYLIIYLYRWEWNRAQISGTILIVAAVGLATTLVLGKLDALARAAERGAGPARRRGPVDPAQQATSGALAGQPPASTLPDPADPDQLVEQVLRAQGEQRASRYFAWLGDLPWRAGVFVPILMGAGALLSALAYGIERLAGAVAARTIDPVAIPILSADLPLGPSGCPPCRHVGAYRVSGPHCWPGCSPSRSACSPCSWSPVTNPRVVAGRRC